LGRTTLSLRLVGELPPTAEVSGLLGVAPTVARRRGEALAGGRETQREDLWLLRLGDLEAEGAAGGGEAPRMAETLRRLAPALAALDRAGYRTELYVGAVESAPENENGTYAGGFLLPWPLVAAAAECGLEVRVSTVTVVAGGG
jgi:hypothetical protein